MRWRDAHGHEYEKEWAEPIDARANDGSSMCGRDTYVWAVPTQEGFALQLNSMLSVLTLAGLLGRVALLMPLLATGPHYRSEVALRRLAGRGVRESPRRVTRTTRRRPWCAWTPS